MSRELSTEIDIAARREAVWAVLTDFPRYPEWNSFLPWASGEIKEEAWIKFVFELPPGLRLKTRARILKVDPPTELRWIGTAPIPGLFSGERYFILTDLADRQTHFKHGEFFGGVLTPLIWPYLTSKVRRAFVAMNEGLKIRLEDRQS